MSTLKVSTISPLGTDATKTNTIGSAGDTIAGMGSNTPSFSAKLSSDQTISASSYTKIQFDSEQWDTDSTYDASTNYRFTPAVAGKYTISSTVMLQNIATAGNRIQFAIYKNGSFFAMVGDDGPSTGSGADPSATISMDIEFNTTDYVEMYIYHNSGTGSKDISSAYSFFSGSKVIGA